MTFLNPLLLFGLAAAAIPLLIHLLQLQKLRTIEFSSLRFLRELQKTHIRKLKFRQILLLLLRTLLIVFLVLAFSRPALQGDLAGMGGVQARSTMTILLDDSPSMGVRNEKGVVFEQAKTIAENILTLPQPGDEIFLLGFSEMRHAEEFEPQFSVDASTQKLSAMNVSEEYTPLSMAAATAAKILSRSANINREIFFVSDGQLSGLQAEPSDSSDIFDERTRVFFATLGDLDRGSNLGVRSVRILPQILGPDKPIALELQIQNGSSSSNNNAFVSIYLDGTRVVQQSLEVPAGSSSTLNCMVVPKRSGIIAGYARLEDDMLEIDNRRHFVLDVPDVVRLSLVGKESETRFLRLALSAVDEVAERNVIAMTAVDPSRFSSIDLADCDVVILANPEGLSGTEGERLVNFVNGGGGLLFFPGNETNLRSMSDNLLKRIGAPPLEPPAASGSDSEDRNLDTGFLTFREVDFQHTLLSGIFEKEIGRQNRDLSIESPKVSRSIRIRPGPSGHTLIELSDGSPFLSEYVAGSGRILMFAIDAGTAWSDFPLTGIFSPLIHRAVTYLGTVESGEEEVFAGDPLRMNSRMVTTRGEGYHFRTPDGLSERAIPQVNSLNGLAGFLLSSARMSGIYELYADRPPEPGRNPLAAAAVNPDPRESALAVATTDDVNSFFASLGVDAARLTRLDDPADLVRVVRETRYGTELWTTMLGIAILCALSEMLVARVTKQDIPTHETTRAGTPGT